MDLGIFAAGLGILSLLLSIVFIYYSYKNALELKGAIGKYLTAFGSFFFLMPGIIQGARVSQSGYNGALRYVSFLFFVMGFLLMLNGVLYSFVSFYKDAEEKSPKRVLRMLPNGNYLATGLTVLALVAFPAYSMSVVTEIMTLFGWIGIFAIAISYSAFAIGERKLYSNLTVSSSLEELPEEKLLFLREDIYALRLYTSLANDYLEKVDQTVGRDNLGAFFASTDIENLKLFSQEIIEENDYRLSTDKLKANLDSLEEDDEIKGISSEFSYLFENLVDFYGRATSEDYAKTELESSFKRIRDKTGENPIVFEILRSLPTGVMEEETYSLLSRQELESRVKKRTAELENVMDTMVDTLIKVDSDGMIEMANDSLYELLGYDEDEIIDSKADKLFMREEDEDGNTISPWKEIRSKIQENGYIKDHEVYYKTKEGEKIPVTFSGSIMEFEELEITGEPSMVCVGKDITERKEAEERAEFLHSLLRHDLGNKLQITRGFLGLVDTSNLSEEDKEYIEDSLKGIDEGVELIENIRTLNNLESGEVETKPMDLNENLKESIERHDDLRKKKDFEINNKIEDEEKIVEGGMLLKELFSNLIENSLKHSEGSKMEISSEEEGEEIRISFEDDGKGIPDEIKEKITEKGFQGEDSSGSGLGMHLAKRIALTYGDDFEVKDSELGGARFDITLKALDQ